MAQRREDKLIRRVIDKLRVIRKARGLTQAAVYEDTSVDIQKYETQYTNLSLTTLAILCEYYEISLGEFFGGLDRPETT